MPSVSRREFMEWAGTTGAGLGPGRVDAEEHRARPRGSREGVSAPLAPVLELLGMLGLGDQHRASEHRERPARPDHSRLPARAPIPADGHGRVRRPGPRGHPGHARPLERTLRSHRRRGDTHEGPGGVRNPGGEGRPAGHPGRSPAAARPRRDGRPVPGHLRLLRRHRRRRTQPHGCVGVKDFFATEGIKTPLINIPGCPSHPDWFIGTVAHVLLLGLPKPQEVDAHGRMKLFYGTTVHRACTNRDYLDDGVLAKKPGELGCLLELGCKGPLTMADCPRRSWNSGVNWCIGSGGPCLGCTEPGFPDAFTPFLTLCLGEEGHDRSCHHQARPDHPDRGPPERGDGGRRRGREGGPRRRHALPRLREHHPGALPARRDPVRPALLRRLPDGARDRERPGARLRVRDLPDRERPRDPQPGGRARTGSSRTCSTSTRSRRSTTSRDPTRRPSSRASKATTACRRL